MIEIIFISSLLKIISMKKLIPVLVFFCALCKTVHAQEYNNTAPYQKDSTIPAFNLLLTDSTWFSKDLLPGQKPVIIIYFSPECGHCQLTAHAFEEKKDELKDIFFVWVSYLPVDTVKKFAEDYKMLDEENVRIGRDPNYFIPSYFRVKFTPFMAVYNKEGKLLKTYESGTDPDTLVKLLDLAKK